MRFDSLGLFWHDKPKERTQLKVERGPLPIPDTGWEMPKEFPRLDAAKVISIDIESHDPDIETKGPGMKRDGYMCGLAIGAMDANSNIKTWYFPFGHILGENMSERNVLSWAKDALAGDQPKVGANILYDIMYLDHKGIKIGGQWHDVLMRAFLLDENHFKYNLDSVAERTLDQQKETHLLYEWLEGSFIGKPASNIWRAPSSLVGPYAETDAALPLQLFEEQQPHLEYNDLLQVSDLESRLLPMLLAMSKQGVRVDIDAAERLNNTLEQRIKRDSEAIGGINVDAPREIAPLFDKLKLEYPLTAKSKEPSFTKKFLEKHPHPIAKQIINLRRWKKFKSTFIEGYVLSKHIDGMLYPSFHPGRARTGRLSSSRPNLQNIPIRDPELGPLIRSLFIPKAGEKWWKLDYSQIEYRYLVHMGQGTVAERLRERYCTDIHTDIHQEVSDLLDGKATIKIDRKAGKNLNFGIVYGLGIAALANELQMNIEDAKELRNTYFKMFPFAKELSDKAKRLAERRGYVRTIMKRRRRFDEWESADWELSQELGAFRDKKEAQEVVDEYIQKCTAYERHVPTRALRRAHTHKALNAVIQGSAADIMKKAMVDIFESGLCNEIVPMLTVHDELDFSSSNEKAVLQAKEIMEQSTKLSIPLLVDIDQGANWGECK